MPRMSKCQDVGEVYLQHYRSIGRTGPISTIKKEGVRAPYFLFSLGGFLEFCDVELLHFHHRLHHPLCFLFVSTLKYLENNIRNDLPEKTELVL